MTTRRIAVIATHPIQYQAPVWRGLAASPGVDVHVYFGSDHSVRGYRDPGFGVEFKWDVPLLDGYPHTFLSDGTRTGYTDRFFSMRASGLSRRLESFRPDCALITAYTPFFWWDALAALNRLRIPVFLRAETTDTALPRSVAKRIVRRFFLKQFYGRCAGFLAIGRNSRDHYLAHSIPPARIGWAPYCVDTDLFDFQVREFKPQRQQLRREWGFSEEHTIFLFSGKLIDKKDPMTLSRALLGLTDSERNRIGLIVAGDGPLRSAFELECRKALGPRSVFPGFINQSRIGSVYAAADCLVLPSAWGETWGLVVNESLQFGLPAVVSDRVGCHPDLIVEGDTGFVFRTGDAEGLKSCLRKVLEMAPERRRQVAERCRKVVSAYSVGEAVEGIREAIFGT
jgi:glycosyltransferase involved in cell wall biosynthesis